MVGKVISASSFSGTVGYVMKEESRILEAEGIMPPEVKDMVQDFKDQTLLNPRLKNTVGHISLSFSPKDAPRMTDALMTRIAKEYMQKMGITDTQYLLVRHLDQPHPHCHLVYNRVGNNGQTISDRNIKIRNAKVCRELTEKYGLYLTGKKDDVRGSGCANPTRPDTNPRCDQRLSAQEQKLERTGRQLEGTGHRRPLLPGIAEIPTASRYPLLENGFEFSGSKIDRAFSFTKLDNRFTFNSRRNIGPPLVGNLSAAAGNTVRHLPGYSATWAEEESSTRKSHR
nr:relaxase/mobilization nuclease domain-containing protein [Alistipes finegoldii]